MPESAYPKFSSDLASFDESINSVDESAHDFMWRRHRVRSVLVHAFSIGFALLFAFLEMFFFDARYATTESIKGAVLLPLLPLVPLAGYYLLVQSKLERLFRNQLAAAIGFTYMSTAPLSSVRGRIFEFGNGQYLYDIFSGMFGAYPGRFFTYLYTTGSGKSRSSWRFTVGEIDYGRELPHLLLRPKRNRLYRDWQFDGSENISVEGGFDDSFDYYAETGKRIEALQVLEPDIMALFHDEYPDFGFETCGTKLYVFCPFYGIRTKAGFIGLHTLLLVLGSSLTGELYNVSTEARS